MRNCNKIKIIFNDKHIHVSMVFKIFAILRLTIQLQQYETNVCTK